MGSASGRSVMYGEKTMGKCVFVERMDRAIVPVTNTGIRTETLRDVLHDKNHNKILTSATRSEPKNGRNQRS